VQILFEAGAKEVNFLVSSPPVKFPDFYGIDTPAQKDLIGAFNTAEQIRRFLGATRLHYLSYDGLIGATGLSADIFCTSCFTGEYPIDIREKVKEVRRLSALDFV
jgi:amidophosphoribosyltransferase